MIDRSFGDYGRMLRTPDLRFGDISTAIHTGTAPFQLDVPKTGRGTLVYLRNGDFNLAVEGVDQEEQRLVEGTAIGFEDGRAHRWRSLAAPGTPVELFVSSIPPQMSFLRRLEERYLAIPPNAEPYAGAMRLAVELHRHQHLSEAAKDDGVIRRCAEICMIQFIDYTRRAILQQPDMPPGLAHDEHVLRAWIAYFREPRRKWTVAALAEAAGLGRTAFAERFRDVFGAPPLQALTEFRLDQASHMLRETRAPLIEIAFTSGYNSEAAFVRAFQRRYDISPGRFRAGAATTLES